MPEVLGPRRIAERIEGIIREAEDTIVLVSPYLRIPQDLVMRLQHACGRGVNVTLVYGKDELKSGEREKLRTIKGMGVLYVPNLHAKCYYNEYEMLVTSMNLHEYSAQNNHELGILLDSSTDKVEYRRVQQEVEVMLNNAQRIEDLTTVEQIVNAPFVFLESLCIHLNEHFKTAAFRYVEQESHFRGLTQEIVRNDWPVPGGLFQMDSKRAEILVDIPKAQRPAFAALLNPKEVEPHYRIFLDNVSTPRLYAGRNRVPDHTRQGFEKESKYWAQGIELLVAQFTTAWSKFGLNSSASEEQ